MITDTEIVKDAEGGQDMPDPALIAWRRYLGTDEVNEVPGVFRYGYLAGLCDARDIMKIEDHYPGLR